MRARQVALAPTPALALSPVPDPCPSPLTRYDVGMSSLLVAEMRHLAQLANSTSFRAARATQSARLHSRAVEMSERIQRHLWNEKLGIFTNRHHDGRLSSRVSPTSFYPLLAGIATDAQATRMVEGWLVDPRRFCVHVEGASAERRHPDCHWGLPSISFSDAAYVEQDYWRGLVWAPTAFLVYTGLKLYDHLPIVRRARKSLVAQMREMLMVQWRAHGHICENYSPHRDALNCTGDRFHHWGALASLLSMAEAGYVKVPRLHRLQPLAGSSATEPLDASHPQTRPAANGPSSRAQHRLVESLPPQPAPTAAPTPSAALGGEGHAVAAGAGATGARLVSATASTTSVSTKPHAARANDVSLRAMLAHWGVHAAKPSHHGWWSWTPFARRWLPQWLLELDGTPPVPSLSAAHTVPRAPQERAGYAQAAAEAISQEGTRGSLESALRFVAGHVMGALGLHSIHELDLDHLDL